MQSYNITTIDGFCCNKCNNYKIDHFSMATIMRQRELEPLRVDEEESEEEEL